MHPLKGSPPRHFLLRNVVHFPSVQISATADRTVYLQVSTENHPSLLNESFFRSCRGRIVIAIRRFRFHRYVFLSARLTIYYTAFALMFANSLYWGYSMYKERNAWINCKVENIYLIEKCSCKYEYKLSWSRFARWQCYPISENPEANIIETRSRTEGKIASRCLRILTAYL